MPKIILRDAANSEFAIEVKNDRLTISADGLEVVGMYAFLEWLEKNTDYGDWHENVKDSVIISLHRFIYDAT